MRLALLAVSLLALAWIGPLQAGIAWGWDETMHTALPAWRMLTAAEALAPGAFFDALHACDRYPFAYPLLLALEQGLFGISEHGARVLGTIVWCATLLAVFALGRRAGGTFAGWLALLAAASCPLALSFAGTALLEVPSAAALALALLAWVRRRETEIAAAERGRRDLAAGTCVALAFFTKFNYGLLLALALALDEALELASAVRRGASTPALRSTLRLASIPALAGLWWFVLPLPGAFELGAAHRAAFWDWIRGNQDQAPASWRVKLLNLAAFFAPNPRVLAVLLIGALAALRQVRRPALRACALVLAVLSVAVLSHRFHLARFLIPLGPALWMLAGVGWARLLPGAARTRAAAVAGLALACALWPGRDTLALADALRFLNEKSEIRAYQERELKTQRELRGSRRLRSLGLSAAESEQLFGALAAGLGAEERIGWIDLTEEVSPAGLQYGLLRRGRARSAFASQLWDLNYISIGGADPGWDDAQLEAWAAPYDALLFSEPHHLRGRSQREFFAGYVARLEARGWRRERLGELSVERPMQAPIPVALFVLRRR